MPIDPSIPLSGNALAPVQLPDFNAMTQTRTAGMENIYKIEHQRGEEAAAAEAAQAKKVADALAPAFATAYRDPSDAGIDMALSLVPAEFRDAVAAQAAKLKSIPSREGRMAAIEASLAGSDIGKAVMARLMTPQQSEALGIQREQNALRRDELGFQREKFAAEANGSTSADYTVITLQDGTQALLDKKTGAVKIPTMPGATENAPLKAKPNETAEQTKQRLAAEKRARDLDLTVSELERILEPGGLIDQSTNSTLGNMLDNAAAFFSYGTDSAAAIARLKPVSDLVLKMVPRFEGPQSDKDTQSYKDAAGNLADPNVPNSIKRAAALEIKRLFEKYREQFEYAPGGGAGDSGVIDFNSLGD